jgi:flagellar assembly protein FliH
MEEQYRSAAEQARAAAFREGEAAARERAAAEVNTLLERLARSIGELAELRPRLRREAEADMLRLAMAVARRILRREMAIDPGALHGLAMAALEKLGTEQVCRVRVHPSMASEIHALLEKSPGRADVEVVADAIGEPGTVVFETERGDLDASGETQLEEIERGLADRLWKA